MTHRRRGILLAEMLTVLMMLGIGGTLMAVAFGSILRSQKRLADFSNRYAQVSDFVRCLSRDVRRAATATLGEADGKDLRQVLVIGEPPQDVSYRFYEQYVERTGPQGGSVAVKRWDPMTAAIDVLAGGPAAGGTAVSATVFWRRTDARDPEPNRRFDWVVRCAGEIVHEED